MDTTNLESQNLESKTRQQAETSDIPLLDVQIDLNPEQQTRIVRVNSAQSLGLEIENITIEALKAPGARQLNLTGMADSTLKDAKEKFISHLVLWGWGATEKLLVNLLPPETTKVGAHHELPILVACRAALAPEDSSENSSENLTVFEQKLKQYRLVGSVSLTGDILPTPLTTFMEQCDPNTTIGPLRFQHFDQLWNFLNQEHAELPEPIELKNESFNSSKSINTVHNDNTSDNTAVNQVLGRTWERFWILAASLARVHVFMIGPPGVGKSHLARWAHGLRPKPQEPGLVHKIWTLSEQSPPKHAPLLCPHSRTHLSEFIGFQRAGLSRPGLFTLAHQGTLILDEFAELNRDCRETLRTVLDQKSIFRNTSRGTLAWPADFWMIATCNPCPCGYRQGSDLSHCRCSETQRRNYFSRLSGPLLERMGLRLVVTRTGFQWDESDFMDPILFELNPIQLQEHLETLQAQLSQHSKTAQQLIMEDGFFSTLSTRDQLNHQKLLAAALSLSHAEPKQCLLLMKILKKAEFTWLPF